MTNPYQSPFATSELHDSVATSVNAQENQYTILLVTLAGFIGLVCAYSAFNGFTMTQKYPGLIPQVVIASRDLAAALMSIFSITLACRGKSKLGWVIFASVVVTIIGSILLLNVFL